MIDAGATRPFRIGVVGSSSADAEEEALAFTVGVGLGRAGAVLVCGGRGGVMAAAARGAWRNGGLTVGILPGHGAEEANPWISLPLPTGMGEARNAFVVRAAEALVSVGGAWGTLSEIALARSMGVPVATLGTPPARGLGLVALADPDEAVAWALAQARARRSDRG